ncbi:MAG TPA: MerR family transcriptional regulator [Polyangiales bacterium]|nr:MerR family transcriptional regulator [Polyangiales bacterium]
MSRTPSPTSPEDPDFQTGERPISAEFTIDELSAVTRVPSRTIRFYQSKGALSPPEIRGRVAIYNRTHVERLKLIAQLQDRGLRIDAIRGLVKSMDRGEVDIAEWLGVEQQLQASWSQDQARTLTEAELYQLAGSDRPGLLADLTRANLIERRGDVYLVESPALLSIAMKLEAVGIDQDSASLAASILKKHLGRAMAELTEFFVARARDGHLDISQPTTLFEALRPLSADAVRILFGKQADEGIRKLLASGSLTSLSPERHHRRRLRRRVR